MSHVALCCWIRETRGRNSQTDTRLSRLNKHAEKNLIRPKKCLEMTPLETPFFPFWLVQKGDWERETKQCMPFSGWKGGFLRGWGWGRQVKGGRGWGWRVTFFLVSKGFIRLLFSLPTCGVFHLGVGSFFFKQIRRRKMNKYEALSILSVLQTAKK